MGIRLPIRLRFLPFDVTYGHRLCKNRDQSVLKIRGSPYQDPVLKIYSRPIPAYRKVELRLVLMNTALGTAMSTL